MAAYRIILGLGLWHRFLFGLLLAAFLLVGLPQQSSTALAQGPESVADLAEGLLDSVVNISTTQVVKKKKGNQPFGELPEGSPFRDFFEDLFPKGDENNGQRSRPQRRQSLGSGFVIDANGIIITNNHVIDGADEITVNFTDNTKLKAVVVGRDSKTDIAVLKVEPDNPLTAVKFGDSKKLRVGDWVMAIGNPFSLGGSVTLGIVSARNRNINSGPYDRFIQTDAAINRGNSGGPLFNMDGEVVGINTAIISPSGGSIGIGFAVPSEIATDVIAQLRDFGETRRGWLGVQIQPVDSDVAESLGLEEPTGALVAKVTEGGPAEKAGIKSGDVILSFDGEVVPKMTDLPRMVASKPVGNTVAITLLRRGKTKKVEVTLGRLEDNDPSVKTQSEDEPTSETDNSATIIGLELSALDDTRRKDYKISDDVEGVLIAKVDPESAAAEKRIREGDIIVEVDQERVTKPSEVVNRISALMKDQRKTVLLLLSNSEGRLRFVGIRLSDGN